VVRRSAAVGTTLAALVAVGGCATGPGAAQDAATPSPSPSISVTTPPALAPVAPRHHRHPASPSLSPGPAKTSEAVAAFRWRSGAVTAASLGKSWHSGCPVGPTALRTLSLSFWGFDAKAHQGTLVVNASYVAAYVSAFRAMYLARFPIRQMRPISAYSGNDNKSMADDNTSAFNCRYAVSNGPKHWSMHAYGQAVDVDPLENPYELDGKVLPPAGAPYTHRSDVRPGMIVPGSAPVRAFAAVHWGWGGYWSAPDYQHFSSSGG
jgi:hypothetical protein